MNIKRSFVLLCIPVILLFPSCRDKQSGDTSSSTSRRYIDTSHIDSATSTVTSPDTASFPDIVSSSDNTSGHSVSTYLPSPPVAIDSSAYLSDDSTISMSSATHPAPSREPTPFNPNSAYPVDSSEIELTLAQVDATYEAYAKLVKKCFNKSVTKITFTSYEENQQPKTVEVTDQQDIDWFINFFTWIENKISDPDARSQYVNKTRDFSAYIKAYRENDGIYLPYVIDVYHGDTKLYFADLYMSMLNTSKNEEMPNDTEIYFSWGLAMELEEKMQEIGMQ